MEKLDFEKMWDTELKLLMAQVEGLNNEPGMLMVNAAFVFRSLGRLSVLSQILGKAIPENELADSLKKAGASEALIILLGKS